MKKTDVAKSVCILLMGIIALSAFAIVQEIAINVANENVIIGRVMFLVALPLLFIGIRLIVYDWWHKTSRFYYILLIPIIGILAGIMYLCIVQLTSQRKVELNAIHEMQLNGSHSANWNIQKQDEDMWTKLLANSYVCENCSRFAEFSEDAATKKYPLIVDTSEVDTEYTVVLGIASIKDGDKKIEIVPTLCYYVGVPHGGLHRYSDTGTATYLGLDRKWHPLIFQDVFQRGQTSTIKVPDQTEFNTVRNIFYQIAQK